MVELECFGRGCPREVLVCTRILLGWRPPKLSSACAALERVTRGTLQPEHRVHVAPHGLRRELQDKLFERGCRGRKIDAGLPVHVCARPVDDATIDERIEKPLQRIAHRGNHRMAWLVCVLGAGAGAGAGASTKLCAGAGTPFLGYFVIGEAFQLLKQSKWRT